MSDGLATRTATEIQPRFGWEEMSQIAGVAAKSGLFKMTESQILTLMMLCESEGIHPIKALQLYDIVDGRPAMKAVAMLARFLESGGSVEWHEQSVNAAEATFTHPRTCPTGVKVRYTMDDAKLAALAHKDNWKKNPADMLVARCCSRGTRRANPACILGMDLPEADEAPPALEVKARESLVKKLASRCEQIRPTPAEIAEAEVMNSPAKGRENPRGAHPSVAETAAELKAAEIVKSPYNVQNPAPPPEPSSEWGKMISGAVLEHNKVLNMLAEENPVNLSLRKAMTVQQCINGVIKAFVADGLDEEALKTNGKRDSAKVRACLDDLWEQDFEQVEAVVAKYLGSKLTEAMDKPVAAETQASLLPA